MRFFFPLAACVQNEGIDVNNADAKFSAVVGNKVGPMAFLAVAAYYLAHMRRINDAGGTFALLFAWSMAMGAYVATLCSKSETTFAPEQADAAVE